MDSSSKIKKISDFHATKLGNNRDLYVYLPPSYEVESDKRYPVLYMHDGQGVFDSNPFSQQSWNIHTTADILISQGKMKEIIIVGISSTLDRSNELTHGMGGDDPHKLDGAPDIYCKGEFYEDFIINEVKPYIDMNFRTLKDRDNTALMGSSMGGLVTYNIGFRHPGVFGKLGIISPYFVRLVLNTLEEVEFCRKYELKMPLKIWMDIGEVEANILVEHVRDIADYILNSGSKLLDEFAYYCVPEAAHTENDWAERVHAPLLYFFGNIGKKETVQLYGRDTIGLTGKKVRINPVVKYDSGFIMSEIEGKYLVDDPDILNVKSDGTIIPRKEGKTIVTFITDGVKASREYKVINELSEFVKVSIAIKVPENTPIDSVIYIGKLQVPRIDDNLYGGEFQLPRDIAIQFKINCIDKQGKVLFEEDKNNNDVGFKRFKAEDDMELNYVVENWAII